MSDRPRPPPRPPPAMRGSSGPFPFPPSRFPGVEAVPLPSPSPRLPLPGRGRASRPRPGPVGPELSAMAVGAQGASLGCGRLSPGDFPAAAALPPRQHPARTPGAAGRAGGVPATCGFPRGRTVSCWVKLPGRARSGPGRAALPSTGGAVPASQGPAAAAPWPLPVSDMSDSGLGKRRCPPGCTGWARAVRSPRVK